MVQARRRIPADILKEGDRFKILLHVSKSYTDATGELWLEAIASGTKVDLQNERMTDRAVSSMERQINSGQIPFQRSHWDDWDGVMGWIKEGKVQPGGDLWVRVWLDREMDYVRTLYRRLQGNPTQQIAPAQLGTSIGGVVPKGCYTTELTNVSGGGQVEVGVIDDLLLDHLAATSKPAYPDARIEGVSEKSEWGRPWLHDIAKACRRRRGPKSRVRPGNQDQEGDQAMDLKDLNKGATPPVDDKLKADPPPPQPPPAEEPAAEPWKTGAWMDIKSMTGDEQVWCQPPAAKSEGDQPPPPAGADPETTKAMKALQATLAQQAQEIRALTNLVKSTPNRRGLAGDGQDEEQKRRDGEDSTSVNLIQECIASKEYHDASPVRQQAMLQDATVKQAMKIRDQK